MRTRAICTKSERQPGETDEQYEARQQILAMIDRLIAREKPPSLSSQFASDRLETDARLSRMLKNQQTSAHHLEDIDAHQQPLKERDDPDSHC